MRRLPFFGLMSSILVSSGEKRLDTQNVLVSSFSCLNKFTTQLNLSKYSHYAEMRMKYSGAIYL